MSAATFTAINGGGGVSYVDGNDMAYQGSGQYCTAFMPGDIQRQIEPIYTGGANGGGTKDYGDRAQLLEFKVTYVAGSEAACYSAWDSDIAVISNVCSVTGGGATYDACIKQGGTKADQPKSTGFGTYRMDATIKVLCVRP